MIRERTVAQGELRMDAHPGHSVRALEPHQRKDLQQLEKRLLRKLGATIREHQLIQADDHIMVALSGGKDSYALLVLLERFRRKKILPFTLTVAHLDQAQPGYDGAPLRNWLDEQGFAYHILRQDTYSVVVDKVEAGKTFCSLCSRLRRGALYAAAKNIGCNAIALGHRAGSAIGTIGAIGAGVALGAAQLVCVLGHQEQSHPAAEGVVLHQEVRDLTWVRVTAIAAIYAVPTICTILTIGAICAAEPRPAGQTPGTVRTLSVLRP